MSVTKSTLILPGRVSSRRSNAHVRYRLLRVRLGKSFPCSEAISALVVSSGSQANVTSPDLTASTQASSGGPGTDGANRSQESSLKMETSMAREFNDRCGLWC